MKRHAALIPISREHHQMLILSQLLKKNAPHYKGLPTDLAGKAGYALSLFDQLIKDHIHLEEEALYLQTQNLSDQLKQITQELRQEHGEIIKLFKKISSKADEQTLNELGELLEKHIRKEERVYFQTLQETMNEDALIEIGNKIQEFSSKIKET